MNQENQKSNTFTKILGSATLAGVIAIAALIWAIYSTRSEDLTMQQQLANQATQIAKQDIQIALNAEQNRLLSERATIDAQETDIESQLQTPFPSNNGDFAITATALSIQASQVEATRQAIEARQQQIEATQTSVARIQVTQLPASIAVAPGLVDCGEFYSGETRRISSGTFVIGDVVINGTAQYDSSESEGTVAYFEGSGDVYSEWGAGCYKGSKEFLNEIVQGQFEFGCGESCSTVRIVIVKANGSQDIEIRNK